MKESDVDEGYGLFQFFCRITDAFCKKRNLLRLSLQGRVSLTNNMKCNLPSMVQHRAAEGTSKERDGSEHVTIDCFTIQVIACVIL